MTPADFLTHTSDDCTGEWSLVGKRGAGLWRCTACAREHPSTPESDRASDVEFARGMQLRSQTRQGRLRDFLAKPPRPMPMIEFPDPADEGEEWKRGP